MKRLLMLSMTGSLMLMADDLPHAMSFQGFTGLVNIPNAQVMNEGDVGFAFNNQFDNHLRGYDYEASEHYAEDYFFGAGLFPCFELQGRLSEAPGYHRDLSGNVKLQLPLPLFHSYLPNVALGYQDAGSSVSFYGNQYIVMDKAFWFVRPSIGYGRSDQSHGLAQRMDGLFGGVEVKTFDWLMLSGEYDGQESHGALRFISTPDQIDWVRLSATAAVNFTDDNAFSFGFSAIFPLYETQRYVPADSTHRSQAGTAASSPVEKRTSVEMPDSTKVLPDKPVVHFSKDLNRLKLRLEEQGLERIRIGTRGNTLVVAYENHVYNWNELDAFGAVLRAMATVTERYERFAIIVLKSGVKVAAFDGSLLDAAKFFDAPSYATKRAFVASLETAGDDALDQTQWLGVRENDTFLKTRWTLSPLVGSFIGTEYGVFDYQLLLRSDVVWNLYDGWDFELKYDLPLAHSENLDPDSGVFRRDYIDGGVNAAILHWSANLFGVINTVSAGTFAYDYYGGMDVAQLFLGSHTVDMTLGWFERMDDVEEDAKQVYLGRYTYSYIPMDVQLSLRGGRYWKQDTGFDVEIKRFFGDVAVSLNYLQSTPQDVTAVDEEVNHYVGIAIELPLAAKHNTLSNRYVQLKGTDAWRYGVRTTVARESDANRIVSGSGVVPQTALSRDYFTNRNRLNLPYLKTHTERLLGGE